MLILVFYGVLRWLPAPLGQTGFNVAPSKITALPVSVRTNRRSGVSKCRAQMVTDSRSVTAILSQD